MFFFGMHPVYQLVAFLMRGEIDKKFLYSQVCNCPRQVIGGNPVCRMPIFTTVATDTYTKQGLSHE